MENNQIKDVPYTLDLLPIGPKRPGTSMKVKSGREVTFTDHDVGRGGSTAKNNADYYRRRQKEEPSDRASAHVFIDDIEVRMLIPVFGENNIPEQAWHVLYNVKTDNAIWGDDANDISVGSEWCHYPKDKARTLKSYNRYIEWQAYMAYKLGADVRKRAAHFELDPGRKVDPMNGLKTLGKTYQDMKNDIYDLFVKTYQTKPDVEATLPYAKEAQAWIKSKKISNATDPYKFTTRGEFWAMLYAFKNAKPAKTNDELIKWVIDQKISDGTNKDNKMPRIQLWAMLRRFFSGKDSTADWRYEANSWVVLNKVSDGLNPDAFVENQAVWTMLHRASKL